jgi:hypothetical protein
VIGGFGAIKDTPGLETSAYVCPSTLKKLEEEKAAAVAHADGESPKGFMGWLKSLLG